MKDGNRLNPSVMPKVSVIVPVFNTEEYLERTVDSLLSQSLTDIEGIFINDHSRDGSLDILRRKAAADSRVRIIDFPEQRGAAVTRNTGLDAATGEYIAFLDSDDWMAPDYLEVLYNKALETGRPLVANSNYVEVDQNGVPNKRNGNYGFLVPEDGCYPPPVIVNSFAPMLWLRLFKASFLKEHDIRFPENSKQGEDTFFTSLAELCQEESFVFRGSEYYYLQRPNSFSREKDRGYKYMMCCEMLYDELLRRGMSTQGVRLFYSGPTVIDTQEKFDTSKAFLMRIREEVLAHYELYVEFDLFLMNAICSCADFKEFLSRYNPNLTLSFIRSRLVAAKKQ